MYVMLPLTKGHRSTEFFFAEGMSLLEGTTVVAKIFGHIGGVACVQSGHCERGRCLLTMSLSFHCVPQEEHAEWLHGAVQPQPGPHQWLQDT